MNSHGVVHFEIPADDPEKLSAFYKDLFGWKVEKFPMGEQDYWMLSTVATDDKGMPLEPGAISGGMGMRTSPDQRPINYVNVESVDEYITKAEALGAKVFVPKMEVPNMGFFAHLTDPQGNPFGIWQDTSMAH